MNKVDSSSLASFTSPLYRLTTPAAREEQGTSLYLRYNIQPHAPLSLAAAVAQRAEPRTPRHVARHASEAIGERVDWLMRHIFCRFIGCVLVAFVIASCSARCESIDSPLCFVGVAPMSPGSPTRAL